MQILRGRVWKLGHNISTDLLMPSNTMFGKMSREEMKQYCLRTIRPEFSREVRSGDIIVAGQNFGCGSSRPAVNNLMDLGVSCVVAESCSAIFFRNSISMGFPILLSPGIAGLFEDGEDAGVDMGTGRVNNLTSGVSASAEAYPAFLQRLVEAGGILGLFRQNILLRELM